MTDYQEGYAKGKYELSYKNAYTPGPPPPPDPGPNQSVTTDEDRAAYQKGYQDGLSGAAPGSVGQLGPNAPAYTSGYNSGKADRLNAPAPPSPNTNNPFSKAYLTQEIEDLGGPCYDPDAMSYEDLEKKFWELKQSPSLDSGTEADRGKSTEEADEDRKRVEEGEKQRAEIWNEWKNEVPEREFEKEAPEPPEMPVFE